LSIDFSSALGTLPIYHYGYSLIEIAKQRQLGKFFLPYKYKRVLTAIQHEHNIHHTAMVGNEHIAITVIGDLVFSSDLGYKAHAIKDRNCP